MIVALKLSYIGIYYQNPAILSSTFFGNFTVLRIMPAKFVFRLTKTKEVFKSLSAFITNYMFELVKQLFHGTTKVKGYNFIIEG